MINNVILMGRLTADPELKKTQSGISACRFTVAVDRRYADKNTGERKTDFISVTAWRNTADFVAKYFSKGRMIIVEGLIVNNNYTDRNGTKHYSYDVLAERVQFGESKTASQGASSAPPPQNQTAPAPTSGNDSMSYGSLADFEEILSDDSVPF